MKKTLVGILIGVLVGASATWLVIHPRSRTETAKTEPVPAPAKPAEKENPLHFPPAKRTAAGITLGTPVETSLTPESPAFGRVLDPSPLVTLIAELATARATGAASEKEGERVKKLFAAGGNASAQAVEMAEANVARDHAAVSSAQARLLATWGRAIAGNLEAVGQALEDGGVLARLDVLPGDSVSSAPKTARVNLPGNSEAFDAEVLGAAPVADPQMQGAGFLVLLRGHPLPAGAALRGTLPGVGEAANVLVVPRGAIVYHQGSAWAFVLGEEETFERKLVSLGRSVGDDRVAVVQGLTAGEQIVVTGPQQLLAAELQAGGAPGED
jgi:hypothetical protein